MGLKFGKVLHLGIVVRDLEKAVKIYEEELGIGPGVFQDWLDQHGPSLHHVKLESDATYEEVVGMAERTSGRKPYLDVRWPDGKPLVAYSDLLEETGLLLEIGADQ